MDVKKILICLLALTTTVSTIPNGAISHSTDYVYAETSADGSFEYSIYDLAKKTVTIKKYTGTDTEVTIPKTIGIIKYKIGTKLKITSFGNTSFCTNSPPDPTRNLIQLFKTLYSYYT